MGSLSNAPDLATATNFPTTKSSKTTSSTTSSTTTIPTTAAANDGGFATLTGLPSIAGAGIPTQVVPFTANAPYMQKSTLPEGTVFIAVGAVLAFLGACVLLWRVMVVWSINRSVRRAAMASIRGSEKSTSAWSSGRGGGYKEIGAGSNLSLDALTSSGKPIRSHFRDDPHRGSTPPPPGLFFSPTAKTPSVNAGSARNSAYLPAGYYAPPSSQTAGGAGTTRLGGTSTPPYARHSMAQPSPPGSPRIHPANRNSQARRASASRDGVPRPYAASARNSYADVRSSRTSATYQSNSASNLALSSPSTDNLPGSRAPSAYLDNLFDNHGSSPRNRH